MKKILAHDGGSRIYRSIIRHIHKRVESITTVNLHNRLYDTCYLLKPEILIYPISEYSQEIHNFITENIKQSSAFFMVIDTKVEQVELLNFLTKNTNIKFIVNTNIENTYVFSNPINYTNMYDDDLFFPIQDLAESRTAKVAILLSQNNELNHLQLDKQLLPQKQQYSKVLFNNPEFTHPQNIGVCNEPDLNFILNYYSYLLDLDQQFMIEASVCKIPVISEPSAIDDAIGRKLFKEPYADTSTLKCSDFVQNTLLPILGNI